VNAYQFTDTAGCRRSGVCSSLNSADITSHKYGHVTGTNVLLADQLHIRGFHHCVGRFDGTDKTLGLDHTKCF
jgi:hypothetical protein